MGISQICAFQSTRTKHEAAPFLEERNAFLSRLAAVGPVLRESGLAQPFCYM
jgi:hypothetical protein